MRANPDDGFERADCVVVGASFAHLACATALARAGLAVTVVEKKPATWFVQLHPRFRTKCVVRYLFDHFQSDAIFNLCLGTRLMRTAAGIVYFHHTGVFDAPATRSGAGGPRMDVDRD